MRSRLIKIISGLLAFSTVYATDVSGTISSNTTWSLANSPYVVTGSILVESGVTLTIEAGVTIKIDDGYYLKIMGTIIAKGTSSNRITFTSNNSNPTKGIWDKIWLYNTSVTLDGDNYSSGTIFEYCDINYATDGMQIRNSSFLLDNSTISNCTNGINFVSVNNSIIRNSKLYSNDNGTTYSYEGYSSGVFTSNKFISNEIYSNTYDGLRFGGYKINSSSNTIKNNIVRNNGDYGMYFGTGDVVNGFRTNLIIGNKIYSNNYGIYLSDKDNTLRENIIINNTNSGLKTDHGDNGLIIARNIFYNNATAMDFQNRWYGARIDSNHIILNGYGIVLSTSNNTSYYPSNFTFTYNTIKNSTQSPIINIFKGSGFEFNYNNFEFVSSGNYVLKNQTANAVDAENNYWGTTTSSEIAANIYDYTDNFELGAVDYDPYGSALVTGAPISPPSGVIVEPSGSGVKLTWTANSESDIAGYKIHYGSFTGYSYTNNVDAGNVTTYTITSGVTIDSSVSVTAYDSNANGTDDMVEGYQSWFSLADPLAYVSSVSSSTNNGSYKAGDIIAITVTFSEAVTVTGTPQITLETGTTDAVVDYASGSGTATLTFNYTVASGETSTDLDYTGTTSLALNSGTIKDSGSNNAALILPAPGAAGSLGANKALIIDTTAPTVSGVNSTTADGTYKISDAVSVLVALDEVVTVTGNPRIQLETGTTDQYASYTSGTGNDTLTFTYTVASGDTTADLDYTSTTALELNSGTINDAAGNATTLTLVSPGATNSLGKNKTILIDGNVPTVNSVNSSKSDAAYGVGTEIPVAIIFNQTVTVTGTPQLTLETGQADAVVNYASGTGTDTLVFNYVVTAGQNSSDLDYASTTALALNSGTIKDASGNDATLTLPTPGTANSLGANKALIIDTSGPIISTVSSTTANAAYKEGDTISVTTTFDEPTFVTGIPQITLETGDTDAVVDYTSGSKSNTLTFNYVIAVGQNTADLDYTSVNALALNSGTVKDSLGNDATLTLPSPGSAGSLGDNKALIIDTRSPTFTITPSDASTGIAVSSNIVLNFDEFIRNKDDTELTNDNVDGLITLKDTNGNGADISFDATINASKTEITIDPTSDFNSEQIIYFAIDTVVEDTLDHIISAGNSTFTAKDIIAPIVSIYPAHGDEGIGTNVVLSMTFSEAIRNLDDSEITNANVASHISLKAINADGADYIFSAEINTEKTEIKITPLFNFDAQKVVYVAIGSTVEDDADNAVTLTSSTFRTGMGADLTGPMVEGVTSPDANTTYTAGDSITINITFNESAFITGEPQLLLETGVTDGVATYLSGSGTKTISFKYLILSTHNTVDLDYNNVDALTLNEGTIKDFVGNIAILTLPEPGANGSLGANKAIKIDNIGPSIKSVNSLAENGAYRAGDTLLISINFDENVVVTGVPQLNLETGSIDGKANYLSGSGDTLLLFKFGIDSLYNTELLTVLSTSALNLNSGSMKDAVGNNATLTLPAIGAVNSLSYNKTILIDNIPPLISLVAEGSTNGIDFDYQGLGDKLSISWMGTDSVSGISKYEYAIGTNPGTADIKKWQDTTVVYSAVISGLSLWDDNTYFVSVMARDKAGNISPVLSADGITIDLSAPTIGTVNDGIGNDIAITESTSSLSANWTGFSDVTSGIASYEYAVGSFLEGTDIKDWEDIGLVSSVTAVDLSLAYTSTYYISIRATDLVGNLSNVATSNGVVVDIYPGSPSITSLSPDTNSTLAVLSDTKLSFNITEPITSVVSNITSDLGDQIMSTVNIENDTEISIDLLAPLTSGDIITIEIDSLTDQLGNITNDLIYSYNIALIADYNNDSNIDAEDLSQFVSIWPNLDLGPVTGDIPNFKAQLDGIANLRDVGVFTRMWHWNLNKAGKMQARYVNTGKELTYINENNSLSIQVPKDVNAVDFYFDYPREKLSIKQFQGGSSNKEIILSNIDTLNGEFLMTAGYLEPKLQSIEVPYTIKGRENVTITAIYRMFNNNGEIMSQGTREIDLKPVPKEFALHQNYPNPFNPITTINYDLPQQSHVNIMIYDILGREVVKLVGSEIPAGYQSVIWNTRNSFGTPVSAGIYFYQIQTKDFIKTKKMVLLK